MATSLGCLFARCHGPPAARVFFEAAVCVRLFKNGGNVSGWLWKLYLNIHNNRAFKKSLLKVHDLGKMWALPNEV